jgi:hypothetical protein
MLLDKRPAVLYVALGTSAALLLLPLLLFPLSSDNDTYQAMAFAMHRGKGLPYLGSWDQNFPGVVLYHLISIKLFGASDIGFRIIDLLNRVAISLLLFVLAKRYVNIRVAMLAVPLTCLLYFNAGFWNAGQRDGFALAWLVVALLQVTSAKIGNRQLLLFGASIALATFIRPTNALFALLILPSIVQDNVSLKDALRSAVAFVLMLSVLFMPWILNDGGLREFYRATIQFNFDVYGPGRASLNDLVESLALLGSFHIASLIGLAVMFRREHAEKATLLLHGCIALALVLMMGKYFTYHFEGLAPVTIVLCLIAIEAVSRRVRFAPVLVLAIALFFFYPRGLVGQFLKRGADKRAVHEIQRNLASFQNYSLEVEQHVASYLHEAGLNASTEFSLLYPGLRWRSRTAGISRFTTTFALTMQGKKGLTTYQRAWRHELDSLLITAKPACIVAAQGPEYLFRLSNISPDSLLHQLPNVSAMIQAEYRVDTLIGGYKIYRRI